MKINFKFYASGLIGTTTIINRRLTKATMTLRYIIRNFSETFGAILQPKAAEHLTGGYGMAQGLLLPLQFLDEEAGVLRLVFKAFALVFGVKELLAQLGLQDDISL